MTPFVFVMLVALVAIAGLIVAAIVIMILRRFRRGPARDPHVYEVSVTPRSSAGEAGPTTSHIAGTWRKVSRMAARISRWPDVELVTVLAYLPSEDRTAVWAWRGGTLRGGKRS
ncbi:hypothetical protein [Nonomuraea helvata]|uniref:DUF2550 family protein n=1 Tax=Nonomuraea helvata TaxID=37484 RepID=A0ABV5S7W2_9ACTN